HLAGTAGKTVTIDVVADAFDAYAFLLGPGLETAKPQDDDSGGRCNARLLVRLPRTGDYFIVVTGIEGSPTGGYQRGVLRGTETPKPQYAHAARRCNALLIVRLPRTGDYFIVVTSSERFATGAYTLSVVPGTKPRSLAPCNR